MITIQALLAQAPLQTGAARPVMTNSRSSIALQCSASAWGRGVRHVRRRRLHVRRTALMGAIRLLLAPCFLHASIRWQLLLRSALPCWLGRGVSSDGLPFCCLSWCASHRG